MGTLTVTTPYAKGGASIVRAAVNDNLRLIPFTFTFSTSYATGGDTIPTGSLPVGYKDLISPHAWGSPGGLGLQLDVANSKLKMWGDTATGSAEITAGTNLQTALGTGTFTVWFATR